MFHKQYMTTGSWLLFMFLMAIPMVNFVVIILVLLDKSYNPSLRNFIKAQLIVAILAIIVLFGLWGIVVQIMRQIVEENGQSTVSIMHYL